MKLEVEDIKKIELLPGETLVIRMDYGSLPRVVITSFMKKFKEAFPDNKLMFISSEMEIYKVISEG